MRAVAVETTVESCREPPFPTVFFDIKQTDLELYLLGSASAHHATSWQRIRFSI